MDVKPTVLVKPLSHAVLPFAELANGEFLRVRFAEHSPLWRVLATDGLLID